MNANGAVNAVNDDTDGGSKMPTFEENHPLLSEVLSEENRQGLDQLLRESKDFLGKARDYAVENPFEAAGLALVGAGAIWAVAFTQPGRQLLSRAESVTMNQLNRWLTRGLKPFITH